MMTNIESTIKILKEIFVYPGTRIIKGLIILVWLYSLGLVATSYSWGNAPKLISYFFEESTRTTEFYSYATKSKIFYPLDEDFEIESYAYLSYRDLLVEYMNKYHGTNEIHHQ